MKKALITGIFGQDGSFLYELLDQKGYQVFGIARKNLSDNSEKIKNELSTNGNIPIVYEINLQEYADVKNTIEQIKPDEIYHLSASHVSSEGKRNGKIENDNELFKSNVSATANLLAACNEISQSTRILTAGSCLMFSSSNTDRQDENTPFNSDNIYGIGKITENRLVEYYRNQGIYACTAILYNHESYRRSEDFVTRKIVKNMCMLKKDNNHRFSLGNTEIKKDWGYAKDYVKAMYMMLQGKQPQDYIVSSGEFHSIWEFLEICAEILQINDWYDHVEINSNITSRSYGVQLYGNANKIERELGWKRETKLREWISEMIMKEMDGELHNDA